MAERGVVVDHATVHCRAIKILSVLATVFRRRKRPVGTSWRHILLVGIELMHMIKKGQLDRPQGKISSTASKFYSLAF